MGLMEFLFCIHKTDLALNSVDRANCANCMNETKYELLSHECVKINRYWRLSVYANAIMDRISYDSYKINISSSNPKNDVSMREVYGLNPALAQ